MSDDKNSGERRTDLGHDQPARSLREGHMQAKAEKGSPPPPTKPPQKSGDSGKSATPPKAKGDS